MYKYGIVVIAYKNEDRIKRLLNALSIADYDNNDDVYLIISIDKSENDKVEKIADEFKWEYGKKDVVTFPHRLGLRNHVIHCGDYLNTYDLDAIAVFEDDTLPARGFFYFMEEATEKYINNKDIAGISLYSHWVNNMWQEFVPMMSSYDNYFMQCAQSWGQIWFRNQWNEFRIWYEKQGVMDKNYWIPQEVTSWPETSWKKYHIKYCIENNKYFVYPYVSYTTCFADKGVHTSENTNALQVAISNDVSTSFMFMELDTDAIKYDAFFENQSLYKLCSVNKDELLVDLYGNHFETNKRYILTKKELPYKIIKSWGNRMVPHEMNLLYNIPGDDIILYDLGNISHSIELPVQAPRKSKMETYFDILDKWMITEERGYKVQDYFLKNKWYHIAIYGKGKIGMHLYNRLKNTEINVDYFIDKNSDSIENDIDVINPKEQLPYADVVVITPVMEFEQIKKNLQHSVIMNFISIDSIFEECL